MFPTPHLQKNKDYLSHFVIREVRLRLRCSLFDSLKHTVSVLGHILGIVLLHFVPLVSKCLNAPLYVELVVVM